MPSDSEKNRPFGREPTGVGAPSFDTLAEERKRDQLDRRRFQRTILLATIAHILLLVASIPKLGTAATGPKTAKKAFKVQPVRFQPPPPRAQKPIPKRKAKKIPIPDPTPDDPEPIVLEDLFEVDIEMPTMDLPIGIPDAPPSRYAGPPIPGNVYDLGSGISKPKRIHDPRPPYTEEARQARIQGMVVLQLVVLEDGSVTAVKILKGQPRGLDQSAIDTVRTWRFEPGRKDGDPVPVRLLLTINFSLQ